MYNNSISLYTGVYPSICMVLLVTEFTVGGSTVNAYSYLYVDMEKLLKTICYLQAHLHTY